MMLKTPRRHEAGFTMIELLIAMAVFSFMLMIVSVGFISLVHMYQAGLASRTTQQNARLAINGIERQVRSSAQAWPLGIHTDQLCFGNGGNTVEYARVQNGSSFDLYRADVTASYPNCPAPASVAGWTKLNDDSVDVDYFQTQVTPRVGGSLGTVVVSLGMSARSLAGNTQVKLSSTDITASQTNCKPGVNTQFCGTTSLTTAGTLRGLAP